MSKTTVEFVIAGDLKVGQYPHIPVRWMLQTALRNALGITDTDEEELREMEGDVPEDWEPSGDADGYAVTFIKAAAVGLCWPSDDPLDCPSLRSCGHDTAEYGSGVLDALLRIFAKRGQLSRVGKDVNASGQKLITSMNQDAAKVFREEVAAEKDFSKDRGAKSTAA